MTELLVTYPAGSTAENAVVVAVTRTEGEVLFAVTRTPCHPESPRWPDQPADRCILELIEIGGASPALGASSAIDGVFSAIGEVSSAATPMQISGSPASPAQIPVRCQEGFLLKDEPQLATWSDQYANASDAEATPCVVHIAPPEVQMAVGDRVSLRVDKRYREAVSYSHSRCHLVSLALNATLMEAWRADKEPPARDSLGNPDFDKLAIVSSKIDERGSLDVYRVGRHVRKAGFSAAALEDPRALAQRVETIAKGWLKSSPKVSISPGKCPLQERRTWACTLGEQDASFPCGGTHPSHLQPDERMTVAISWDPAERCLQMRAEGGNG
jgi:alanyl-tRNA synthetase